MKKILLLIGVFCLLCSCAQYRVSTQYIDFSGYGIFLSQSNSVSFDHEPIGLVFAIVEAGMEGSKFLNATVDDALYALCEEALDKGAKGIINLTITYTATTTKQGSRVIETIRKINASGMAIKW